MVNQSQKKDRRIWVKWMKSGAVGRVLYTYPTFIELFLRRGHKVVVVVENEFQRVPANAYINGAIMGRFPKGDAVCEVIPGTKFETGDIKDGRMVICYHRQ